MDYLALAGVILVLNNIFLQGFLYLHIPVYPAKILTEITLFLISWLVQGKVIFRKREVNRDEKTYGFCSRYPHRSSAGNGNLGR